MRLRRCSLLLLALPLAAGVAAADKPHPILGMFDALPPGPDGPEPKGRAPAFTFGPERPTTGGNLFGASEQFAQFDFQLRQPIVGVSRDGKAAWLASEVDVWMPLTSEADDVPNRKPDGFLHATAVVDGGPSWSWVMWHAGWTSFRKQPRPKLLAKLPAVTDQISGDAAPVVAHARATLADPQKLAASVDDRKDAVLLGSAPKERYAGTKDVRATLLRWKLAFQVQGGVAAGLTSSKSVAWVAANVDARPHDKPQAKATPYRVTLVYEQVGGAWKLVALQFSSVPVT